MSLRVLPLSTRKHLLNISLCLGLVVGIYNASLGPDLVSELRDFTGRYGAYLLLISLLFTPLSRRWSWVKRSLPLRRNIGVWGFIYGSVHFLVWIALEFAYDWSLMWQEIAGNLFIWLGILAFLLLIPLAVTSNRWGLRRYGYRQWQRIHTLAYIAVPAVIAHHFMAQKLDVLEPLLMGTVLFFLLLWRYRHAH